MANAEFSLPNLRAVMMANPSITAGELAQNFGVSVDTINNALGLDTSSWDQSVLDYYNQLENYRKQMEEQGFFLLDPRQQGGYFEPKTGMFVNTSFIPEAGVSIPSIYGPANQDYYRSMMGQYTDPSQFYQTVMRFEAPMGGNKNPSYFGAIVADPNAQYALTDKKGNLVYSGTGYEALTKLKSLIPGMSTGEGDVWDISVLNPSTQQWEPSGARKIDSRSGFFEALGSVLPVLTSLIPGLGPLATIATQAASGAAGAALAHKDPLMGGLMAGATAGLMKAPILSGGQSLSGALGGALGLGSNAAQKAASQAVGGLPSDIVVSALPKIATTLPTALTSGLTSLALDPLTQQALNQYAGQATQQQPLSAFDRAFPPGTDFSNLPAPEVGGGLSPSAFNDILVKAYRPATTGFVSSGIPGIVSSGLASVVSPSQIGPNNYLEQIEEPGTTVVGQPEGTLTLDQFGNIVKYVAPVAAIGGGLAAAGGGAGATSSAAGAGEATGAGGAGGLSDIVVTAGGQAPIDVSGILAGTAPLTTEVAKEIAKQTAQQAGKGPLTVNNALRAASLISGLVGAGTGGGNAASGASRPLGSVFSAQLPTTSKIATARQPFAVMPDMTRYGRGAPSLAAQVPQYGGVMPPGFNPDTMEWLGPQKEKEPEKKAWGGYAEGGVDGPGDGRSDSIPAQLSDGEYVIDAETVALLGNGSNKAGAKKLDQFRVNIRKSKGKHLAKGKFSVNAKRPESYLGAK